MPAFRTRDLDERDAALGKRREVDKPDPAQADVPRSMDYQRAVDQPGSLSPADVRQLQRSIGNRAVGQLLGPRVAPEPSEREEESVVQRAVEEDEELECPGSEIRSGGLGRGEGIGQGSGPIGYPKEDEW